MGEHHIIDVRADTPLVPTSLSLDASAAIEDACPISCDVEETAVWITFGSANRALNLMLTDQALLNLARMANKAVHAMLRARGISDPDMD
jgi:hypothetical protein